MLAVKQAEGVLTIVLNDPLNFYAIEDIRQLTGMQLEICLSGLSSLRNAIGYYYSEVEARKAASVANEQFEDLALTDEFNIEEEGDDDTPIINLLSRLIDRAYNTNASDIHIEPFEDKTTVRMRIDGVIVEFVTLQKKPSCFSDRQDQDSGKYGYCREKDSAGRAFPYEGCRGICEYPCFRDPYRIWGEGSASSSGEQFQH